MADETEKRIIEVEIKEKGVEEYTDKLEKVVDTTNSAADSTEKLKKDVKSTSESASADLSQLDGVTGGLASKFDRVRQSVGGVTKGMGKLKGAIIATGIGILVVALGEMVAHWDDIKNFIKGADTASEKLLRKQRDLTKEAERQLNRFEMMESQLRLQGKTEEEINKMRHDRIKLVIAQQVEELKLAKSQLENLENTEKKWRNTYMVLTEAGVQLLKLLSEGLEDLLSKFGLDLDIGKQIENGRGAIFDMLLGSKEDIAERKQEIKDIEDSILEMQQRIHDDQLAKILEKRDIQELDNMGMKGVAHMAGGSLDKLSRDLDTEGKLMDNALIKDSKRRQAHAETVKLINRQRYEAEVNTLAMTSDALAAFSEFMGENTAAAKLFAGASAAVNMWLGVTEVWSGKGSSPFVAATIAEKIAASAIVVANGLNAIRSIRKVSIPNANVAVPDFGGSSGSSVAPTPVVQPNFNIVGDSGTDALRRAINNETNTPSRAYVLLEDVQTSEQLDREIKNKSTFG